MEKRCIGCGMPMLSPADHAMGNEMADHCSYCAREDGGLKSYEEILDSLTDLVSKTRHLSFDAARAEAAKEMADLPAWRNDDQAQASADQESCGCP